MAIVTFMSDFGTSDHYVAAVKANILKKDPTIPIIDISHSIKPFDIGHAAYVTRLVYNDFPVGTIHLIAVDNMGRKSNKFLVAQLNGHFFVCPDNGIISLIDTEPAEKVYQINTDITNSTFPAKDILAEACANLQTMGPESIANPVDQYIQLLGRQVKATKKEIVGNVIRVDHFGNLITNIEKQEFETIHKLNKELGYSIRAGREIFQKLNQSFSQVDPGECYIIFNSNGLMQIGINKGDASKLLGLKEDTPIFVQFNQ